jgi:hypothetical protein
MHAACNTHSSNQLQAAHRPDKHGTINGFEGSPVHSSKEAAQMVPEFPGGRVTLLMQKPGLRVRKLLRMQPLPRQLTSHHTAHADADAHCQM